MPAWPDEAYEKAAFDVGLACLELLTNEHRWVHRRVETIDILRRELARRQVTVEFTLPPDLRDSLRVGDEGPWCVPLAVLKKQPLRHFDLREDSSAIPILGRVDNGRIAMELLAASAVIALDPDPLRPEVADALEQVASTASDVAIEALRALVERADHEGDIARVLEDETAGFFVATLAESYILVALIDEPDGRRILKYSYDEFLDFGFGGATWHRKVRESLGWLPLLIDVPVPAAARGSSYHAEVVVPEELRLDAFVFDQQDDTLLSTTVETAVDRAALHAPEVPLDAEPYLVAAVYAERSGTPAVAAAISLVTAATLAVGITLGNLDSPTAGSSTAVVLAGSALFAGTVARGGEHRLVRDVFLGARAMLALVALAALAAAASIAFGANASVRNWVWGIGSVTSAVAAGSLAVAWKTATPLRRRQDPSA